MAVEVAVRVPPCAPVAELLGLVRRMEEGGIDRVAFADSQLLWRDAWSTVTAAALSTSQIRLGIAVTNPVTRHPTVTASAARTVAEIAPGRLVVGVGAGDSSVTTIGTPRAGHSTLGKTVSTIRALLRGEDVPSDGKSWHLHDPVDVPVLLAAVGPRNLALAGQVADGVITGGADFSRDRSIVREAAQTAGRDPDALAYAVARLCVITEQPERDAAIFKPMCTRMVQMGGAPLFAAAGLAVEVPPGDAQLGDLGHPDDWDEAVRICSKWISDEAALWYGRNRALFGNPTEIAAQIRRLEDAGATQLHLAHPGSFTLPTGLVEGLVESVLPLLRGAGDGSLLTDRQ
jgi:5,10-methylenetetrahydromethanopterin reductase